jgi:Rrf2 family nitric oxide-sensitive transcriptional repressor
MQISRKSEYAIHSLMILAYNRGQGMSVDELATMQEISQTYLAKVMQKMAGVGLVQSCKGFNGGYTLAALPSDISLGQVVALFEEEAQFYTCMDAERGCQFGKQCLIHRTFHKAYIRMLAELEQVHLADLLGGMMGSACSL